MNRFDFLNDDGEMVSVELKRSDEMITISTSEGTVELERLDDNLFSAHLNGHRSLVAVAKHGGVYYIDCDSVLIELRDPDELGFAGGAGDHAAVKDKIFAPMPGKIVKIQVAVGDRVKEKQPMVIVEAMKMENQVLARASGTVKSINFGEADQVDTESPIIELELDE